MASQLQEGADDRVRLTRTFSDENALQSPKKKPRPIPRHRHTIVIAPDRSPAAKSPESPKSAPPVAQKPKRVAPPTTSPKPKGKATDMKFETFPRTQHQEPAHASMNGVFSRDASTEEVWETPPSTPPVAKSRPTKQLQLLPSLVPKKEVKQAILSDRVSLKGFLQNYSGSLPLRVEVLQGFYGAMAELYTGEVYDVYFKKLTQFVVIEDVSGNKYNVPLNSSLQFGLMYDDHNPVYEKVSDLLALTDLPKVICSTNSYSSGKEESTIYANELLIVLGVHVYDSKSKMGLGDVLDAFGVKRSKRALRVLSLESEGEKIIDEQCTGDFVTNPSHLALYLPEIVKYVPTPFPSPARVFLDTESTSELPRLPESFLSGPVTLREMKTKMTLVASKVEGDDSQSECNKPPLLYDIPVSGGFSEVEVSVVYDGNLANRARTILESFDPTKLTMLKETSSNRNQKFQDALNSAVRVEHEGDGIVLESSCGLKDLTALEKRPDSISTRNNQAYKPEEADFKEEEDQVDYEEITFSSSKDSVPISSPASAPHPSPQITPSATIIQQLTSISSSQRRSSSDQQTPSDNKTADVSHPPSVDDVDDDNDSYERVDPSLIDTPNSQDYVLMQPSLYSRVPPPVPAFTTPALVERLHNLEEERKKDRHFLDQTAARVSNLSEQIRSLQTAVEELLQASKRGEIVARSDGGETVTGAVTQDGGRAELSVNDDGKNAEDNRQFLKGLDAVQVIFGCIISL